MPPWQLLYVKIVMLLCEMRDWCGEHMTRFLCEWQDEFVMIIYELNKICHLNKRRMYVTLKHPMSDKMWLNTRWQCETIQDDVYNVTMWQYNSVLNVKAVVAAFNQEKALVGALSVIVQLHRLIVCCVPSCGEMRCGGSGVSGSWCVQCCPLYTESASNLVTAWRNTARGENAHSSYLPDVI